MANFGLEPHILMIGPPKSGKRTLASAILKRQDEKRPGRLSSIDYTSNIYIHTIEDINFIKKSLNLFHIFVIIFDPTETKSDEYLITQIKSLSSIIPFISFRLIVVVTKMDIPTLHIHNPSEDIPRLINLIPGTQIMHTCVGDGMNNERDLKVINQTADRILTFLNNIYPYDNSRMGDNWDNFDNTKGGDTEVHIIPSLQRSYVPMYIWSCLDTYEIHQTKTQS